MLYMDLHEYLLSDGRRQADLAKAIGAHAVLVNQWAHKKRRVPAERCPDIERATDGAVRCEDLRPDVDWATVRKSRPTDSAKRKRAA